MISTVRLGKKVHSTKVHLAPLKLLDLRWTCANEELTTGERVHSD
jgi:hypothetical protein